MESPIDPPPAGLTSSEACQQLSQDIHNLLHRKVWSKTKTRTVSRALPTIIVSLYTLVCGIFLFIACVTGDREYRHRTIPLLVLLLLYFLINIVLKWREAYTVSIWHVTQLLTKADSLLNPSSKRCPWGPSSYPPQPISTQRSQITVSGIRDNVLVNIPTCLLVSGDVILVYPGVPLPAAGKLVSNVLTEDETFSLGSVLDPKLFCKDGEDSYMIGEDVSFATSRGSYWFKVTETPIVSFLKNSVKSKRGSLEKEVNRIQAVIAFIIIPVLFLTTIVINLIRFFALPNFFTPWQVVIVSWEISLLLPFLILPLQLVWLAMTTFNIAKVSLLLSTSRSSNLSEAARGKQSYWLKCLAVMKQFVKVFFQPSQYPLPRVVEQLGNLTAICAVDKEFVLTGGLPTPERVFFLRGKKSLESSSRNSVASHVKRDISFVRTLFPADHKEELHESTEELNAQEGEVTQEMVKPHEDSEQGEDMVDNDDEESTPEGLDSLSRSVSDVGHIEVITEIMDITPKPDSLSGIGFDDPGWTDHLDSLKPIGVNTLTTCTSNCFQAITSSSTNSISAALQSYLCKTQSADSLGVEIGVTEYSKVLTHQNLVYILSSSDTQNGCPQRISTLPRKNYFSTKDIVQPHLISCVFQNTQNDEQLLMSRGSGDVVAWCCRDFWDGKDLQPVGHMERMAILDFFNRRSLTSHCIALCYTPLLENTALPSSSEPIGLVVPYSKMKSLSEERFSYKEFGEETGSENGPDPKLILDMVTNQVFLGIVSLQYRPKPDVVDLIQDLRMSGIRFIHFTAENELRGKVFGEKLGLEAGWNCHISLAPCTEDEVIAKEMDDTQSTSSSSSSSTINSVINAFQSYFRAKLPKGIDAVRPHLQNVDNVPLLVPLFTDCTPETVCEMIQIMHENGEVVLCMGNPWVRENLTIFAKADVGLSLTPSLEDMQAKTSDCSGSVEDKGLVAKEDWPSPLDLSVALNSFSCEVHLERDADVSLRAVVRMSRHLLGCVQRALLFGFGCNLSVGILLFLCHLFFLPPALSTGHVYWLTLLIIPLQTLALLFVNIDPNIEKRMPDRKKRFSSRDRLLILWHFLATYLPSIILLFAVFWLSLYHLCSEITEHDCHFILGNQNTSVDNGNSSSLGWMGDNRQGLLLAQDCTALILTVTILAISIRFIHRIEPFWHLWKFITWQYLVMSISLLVLQVIFFAVSQIIASQDSGQCGMRLWCVASVPVYVWVFLAVWAPLQVLFQELFKWRDRRRYVKTQRRLRLSFETKLGMNSPF